MTQPELISFRQASVLTNVSERTLTRMADRGELTVFWFGKTKRLSVQELLRPRSETGQTCLSGLTEGA